MEETQDIENQDALKEIRQEYNSVRVRAEGSVLEHSLHFHYCKFLHNYHYHVLHLSDYQQIQQHLHIEGGYGGLGHILA